jgi:hypothetical protein
MDPMLLPRTGKVKKIICTLTMQKTVEASRTAPPALTLTSATELRCSEEKRCAGRSEKGGGCDAKQEKIKHRATSNPFVARGVSSEHKRVWY